VDAISTTEDAVAQKTLVLRVKEIVKIIKIVMEILSVETTIVRILTLSSMRKMIVALNQRLPIQKKLRVGQDVVDVILMKEDAVALKTLVLRVKEIVNKIMIVMEILSVETTIARLLDLSSTQKMIAV